MKVHHQLGADEFLVRLDEWTGLTKIEMFDSTQASRGLGLAMKYTSNMLGRLRRRGLMQGKSRSRVLNSGYTRGISYSYRISKNGLKRLQYLKYRRSLPSLASLVGTGTPRHFTQGRMLVMLENLLKASPFKNQYVDFVRRVTERSVSAPLIPFDNKLYLTKLLKTMFGISDLLSTACALQADGIIPPQISLPIYITNAKQYGWTDKEIMIALLYLGVIDQRRLRKLITELATLLAELLDRKSNASLP